MRPIVAVLVAVMVASGCSRFRDDGSEEVLDASTSGSGDAAAEGAADAAAPDAADAGEGGGSGTTGTLQLPPDTTKEASSANTSPFGGAGQRFQSVYARTLLSALPKGAILKAIRFRLDGDQPAFAKEDLDNLEIRLSTSKNAPGALSTSFAANRGLDEVIVRAGRFAIDPADYPAGKKPNPFGKPIAFQRDFVYNGGDLLLEIGATALTSGRNVDNVSPLPSKEGQSVYGNGFSAAVATGTPFFDLIVVEFTFEYP
ncbi:MAG: hypothetical protein JST00_37735 [Deltaproteobacteria bacterium]|nr:hypothetical protein [Deltaproteobacteria bacterium]